MAISTGEIEILEKRMENLERLLMEINSKIENFMGYEELSEEEEKEVDEILKEVKDGKYAHFEELFE